MIDTGGDAENAVIATVGTAGATTLNTATAAGAAIIPVRNVNGFRNGQTITIDTGAEAETAEVSQVRRFGPGVITLAAPLTRPHAAGAQVSGSGITLTSGLRKPHKVGAQVTDHVPTPGAPNQYSRKQP